MFATVALIIFTGLLAATVIYLWYIAEKSLETDKERDARKARKKEKKRLKKLALANTNPQPQS